MTQVSVAELRAISDLLFSHLVTHGNDRLNISAEHYWDVPQKSRYDRYTMPTDLTLGQLSDDLTELRKMLEGRSPVVSYGLVWLAAILRKIGEDGYASGSSEGAE